MNSDVNDTVIVRATIDLAHNMGLRVVAKGMESQETLSVLTASAAIWPTDPLPRTRLWNG